MTINFERVLTYPNVQAMLKLIRTGEGTTGPNGYSLLFGGSLFQGFSDHPRKTITLPSRGKPLSSTAAGAYQILAGTWDTLRQQYGLEVFPDFSPASQDKAAIALISGRNALNDVCAGNFQTAIGKCNKEWASLPGSPYGQPTLTMEKALQIISDSGGTIAD